MPESRLFIGCMQSTVHHGVVELSEAEQEEFRQSSPPRLSEEEISTILETYNNASLHCQPMDAEDAA